jgi:signal transduction histidine kinase
LLALVFSRIVTSSLSELTLSVQRFRAGEFDRPIDLPPGGEVGNLAEAFNRMREELLEKERVRNRLLNQIINAQEEERRRIARELHDGLGQSLNALVFGLNTAGKTVGREPQAAIGLLSRLNISVSETIKELQEIIYDLRPSLLDDHGLIQALGWLADERLRNGGIAVTLETERAMAPIPHIQETVLFRIGQEAVTNIRKYAQAKTVRIGLVTYGGFVELEVRDDGIGFEPTDVLAVKDKTRGWGLLGMRERASLLGGQLNIESSPGQGTCLRAVLPLGGVEE